MVSLIFIMAFALRVAVIPFLIGNITDPVRNHWEFGWEEGRIARSIASGEGFSSPLFGNTGPTAWTCPIYPYLVAGMFRIFGIYSTGAAWAVLILNSLFSALTCIPVYFIARRCFGASSGRWAAGIWAFFPYAIYLASSYVWGFCLDTLMLTLVVWITLAMEGESRPSRWAGYGLLWGVAALTNAVILSTLPFLLAWLAYRSKTLGTRWLVNSGAALLVLLLTVSPWFIRNYAVFHRFIPFRSTFWMTFWEGNTGDISDLYPDWTNPAHSPAEMEEFRRLGELGYARQKKLASLDFVERHPGLYLRLSLRRFIFTWTGFWTLRKDYLAGEPFALPNIALTSAITLLLLLAAWRALLFHHDGVLPLLLVLLSYPVVYYITHPGTEYRHPIDPICVVFIGYLLSSGAWRRRQPGVPVTSKFA
ncbi:MAG TPA: glycosyltransferase family 39 protein [Candidatus Acidoferrales bacterium]|nr:glycosyltransferase family 39 protein [Candidatus Acidoferrales bacterium]